MQNGRSLNSDHRRHDRLLVARFAADDAYPAEVDEARELVESCSDCAALADDIRSLSVAMSRLPDARRKRDFRITPEQADRLRGNWFERFMRKLATPSFGMLRPVAGVAMSIGLALVIVGSLPGGAMMAGAPASDMGAERATNDAPAAEPSMAPGPALTPIDAPPPEVDKSDSPSVLDPTSPEGKPTSTGDTPTGPSDVPPDIAVLQASEEPESETLNNAYMGEGEDDAGARDGESTAVSAAPRSGDMLIIGGVFLAVAGLALLALIWFARRRFRDPLVG